MMLMDCFIRILDARSTSNLGINVGLKKGFRRKIYQLLNNRDWGNAVALFWIWSTVLTGFIATVSLLYQHLSLLIDTLSLLTLRQLSKAIEYFVTFTILAIFAKELKQNALWQNLSKKRLYLQEMMQLASRSLHMRSCLHHRKKRTMQRKHIVSSHP